MQGHWQGGVCGGRAGGRPRPWGSSHPHFPPPPPSLAGRSAGFASPLPRPGCGFHFQLAEMGGVRIPLIEILPRKLVCFTPNPHPRQELPNGRFGQLQRGPRLLRDRKEPIGQITSEETSGYHGSPNCQHHPKQGQSDTVTAMRSLTLYEKV